MTETSPAGATIRVLLPYHLSNLAGVEREVRLALEGPATIRAVLDALETRHPALKGTLRDHATGQRRPFIRFFACGQDLSLDSPDSPLPEAVLAGKDVFRVVGAMAGG